MEREEQYAGKVETILSDKFEQIKLEAINSVNTQSANLKPGCVVNTLFKANESAEEEVKEGDEEQPAVLDKQTELYRGLTDLMMAKPGAT